MVHAILDGNGKLLEFSAVPYDAEPAPAAVAPEAVFHAAGLDLNAFSETAPVLVPASPFDQRRAWKGPPQAPRPNCRRRWHGGRGGSHGPGDLSYAKPVRCARPSLANQARNWPRAAVMIGRSSCCCGAAVVRQRADRRGAWRGSGRISAGGRGIAGAFIRCRAIP